MKLSIITINYNNASHLKNTISSVIGQTWKEFEYLIIDGGSNDESVNIIKQNEEHINYWVSEPDKGVYHAMNKGIRVAAGEYLLMLNSGDNLADTKVLERVFASSNHKEDILLGDVYLASNGKIFENRCFPNILTFNFFRHKSLSHQGSFIKKQSHNLVGLYDESLKFASDWKFFILAICKFNLSYKHLGFFIADCDCTGLTWNPKNFLTMKLELELVFEEHFPAFIKDYEDHDKIRNRGLKKRFISAKQNIKKSVKDLAIKSGLWSGNK